jgi:hypothetical protein
MSYWIYGFADWPVWVTASTLDLSLWGPVAKKGECDHASSYLELEFAFFDTLKEQ